MGHFIESAGDVKEDGAHRPAALESTLYAGDKSKKGGEAAAGALKPVLVREGVGLDMIVLLQASED